MLRCLLLSRDQSSVRMITRGLHDLEVELEAYSDSDHFLARAMELHFDAILLDDEVENAHVVLDQVLTLASCHKSVRIVLADPKATMHPVYKTGTQVVLYKPLAGERLRQGLRAVRNLMARERRRGGKRVPAMIPARISPRHARFSNIQVLLADVSESGVSLRFEKGDLPSVTTLNLDFALPGEGERIQCVAELVWQDFQGSAGVRFLDMPSVTRRRLAEWLKGSQKTREAAASGR